MRLWKYLDDIVSYADVLVVFAPLKLEKVVPEIHTRMYAIVRVTYGMYYRAFAFYDPIPGPKFVFVRCRRVFNRQALGVRGGTTNSLANKGSRVRREGEEVSSCDHGWEYKR